jgi:hypothetical protein
MENVAQRKNTRLLVLHMGSGARASHCAQSGDKFHCVDEFYPIGGGKDVLD